MEKKTKFKFKVGDRVFASYNSPWGRRVMIVVGVSVGGCTVRNPEFTEEGWFTYDELMPYTRERARLIHELFLLEEQAGDLKQSLFGK